MANDSRDGQQPLARAHPTHADLDSRNGRTFGQLPDLVVPDDFDEALPPEISGAWESDPATLSTSDPHAGA